MKIYLAGPITGLTFGEGQEWRQALVELFAKAGVRAVSPLRGKHYLADVGKLSGEDQYSDHPMSTDKGIITRDSNDVRTSDLVIANVLGAETTSGGTCVEIGIALQAQIPVILVMEPKGNPHDRHMIRGACGFIVHSLEEAVPLALTVLGFDVQKVEGGPVTLKPAAQTIAPAGIPSGERMGKLQDDGDIVDPALD